MPTLGSGSNSEPRATNTIKMSAEEMKPTNWVCGKKEGGREGGGREGGREGGRDRGREGGREERSEEGRREGMREEGRREKGRKDKNMKRREEKIQLSQFLPLEVSLSWISNPQWKSLVIFLGSQ